MTACAMMHFQASVSTACELLSTWQKVCEMSSKWHLGQVPMQLVQRAGDQALLLYARKHLIEEAVQILHSVAAGEEHDQLGRPARLAVLAQQRRQHDQPLLAGDLHPQPPGISHVLRGLHGDDHEQVAKGVLHSNRS